MPPKNLIKYNEVAVIVVKEKEALRLILYRGGAATDDAAGAPLPPFIFFI